MREVCNRLHFGKQRPSHDLDFSSKDNGLLLRETRGPKGVEALPRLETGTLLSINDFCQENLLAGFPFVGNFYGISAHAAESRCNQAVQRIRRKLGYRE